MCRDFKAIFFDWDGTAVQNRTADATRVLAAMEKLLLNGRKLIIISGTTYENICGGNLESLLSPQALQNLYLGLGRGVYDYGFTPQGKLTLLANRTPDKKKLLNLHELVFKLHCLLLENYNLPTDICFSRPNYCKVDLTVDSKRGSSLFLQEGEVERTENLLAEHGFKGGINGLCRLTNEMALKAQLDIEVTTDAKFLEIGYSTKSTNVNAYINRLSKIDIPPQDCSFWGDEFGEIGHGVWGSDSLMITDLSKDGSFYSVSELGLRLPENVKNIGGGCNSFIEFLEKSL